jgi:hypothetical protein
MATTDQEKSPTGEGVTQPPASAGPGLAPDQGAAFEGVKLMTVVYSQGHDLYRVAPYDAAKGMWVSVTKFPMPLPSPLVPRMPYLGVVQCGAGWRKAYSVDWSVVQPGITATLPENDPLVIDYAAALIA